MLRRCGSSTLRAGVLAALTCLVTVAGIRAPVVVAMDHRPPTAVFGFNYVRGAMSQPERYFSAPTPARLLTIRSDFVRMRRLGANVVRIYLQLPDFMRGPESPAPRALR